MALTQGVFVRRVGDVKVPIGAPMGAGVTVYPGSIALVSSSGYLKNASSPAATDVIMGLIGSITGGTGVQTGQAITNSGSNGDIWIDCLTGTFLLQNGTGADELSEANVGDTVYVVDETTVGATNGGSTRPAAGTMLPIDPTVPSGFVPVKLYGPAGG